jgi:serine/threonine protein kinase
VSPASPEDADPPELPGYCFLRRIGAGGNAQVYLYEQELPSRKVAVKVLNDSALSAAARRQFITEANVTAVLAHRHIVQVFDAKVTDDGRPYIVMPFYPQPNLFVRARRAHFSVAQVLRIGIQIGSAVETSHRNGVLHRDIKPQNILTDSYGEPALTDFGIATTRPGDGPAGLSVPWSPPEILFGTGPGDRRSDVYSLGATLWHLLAGRPPFEQPGSGSSTGELKDRINSDPPPRTQRADVPDSLERLLRQAMAKDPAARPQSAMELIRALQSIEQELRLPLTHPILPADEPAHGGTRDHDTVARPAANAGGSTFSREQAAAVIDSPPADQEQPAGPIEDTRAPGTGGAASQPGDADSRTHAEEQKQIRPAYGQRAEPGRDEPGQDEPGQDEPGQDEPAWNGETQDLTSPRGSQRDTPRQAAADPAQAVGRSRAPTVPGPPSTTGISDTAVGAAAPARMPVVLDPSGGVASFTGDRDVGGNPGKSRRARGRVLVFAGGGTLLVVVTAVIVLALQHSNGDQSYAATGAGQATPPGVGENALAPGQPVVTASRVNAGQVEFQWTYSNSASGDTFRWQEMIAGTGERAGLAAKPDLLLAVTKGRSACITVTVRSADGEASKPSSRVCSPK